MENNINLEKLKEKASKYNLDVNEVVEKAIKELHNQQDTPTSPKNTDTEQIEEIGNAPSQKLDEIWERVQLARHPDRPTTMEYVEQISEQFMEIHGDRCAGDDQAMVGGICTLDGAHFTFIGTQKGANMKENLKRNYGMPHPEGYRKALRLAKQAEHFRRPIITFIDTAGAFPGLASEERGIAESIAKNLMDFSMLETPIICVFIGEGGSGGALGIGIGDAIYMLENAVYSVITPEGFASILLRDVKRAKEAAALMKMTAPDVLTAGFIDGIIPEPRGGAQVDFVQTAEAIKTAILTTYQKLKNKDISQLLKARSQKIIDWTRDAQNTQSSQNPQKDILTRIRSFFD